MSEEVEKVIIKKNFSFVGGIVSVILELRDLELEAEDKNIYCPFIVKDEEDPTIYNIMGYKINEKTRDISPEEIKEACEKAEEANNCLGLEIDMTKKVDKFVSDNGGILRIANAFNEVEK